MSFHIVKSNGDNKIIRGIEYKTLQRNYGSKELSRDVLHEDARHYELKVKNSLVQLGTDIKYAPDSFSSVPKNEDGIVFPKDEDVKDRDIIFLEAENILKGKFSHDKGYINVWIADAKPLKPTQSGNTTIYKNYKNLSWQKLYDAPQSIEGLAKDGDRLEIRVNTIGKNIKHNEPYIVRVRYSLDKEEILKVDGPSLMGEAEDYLVYGSYPVVWKVEQKGLGIPINDQVNFGANDDKLSHKEVVEYRVTFKNRSQTSMPPTNLFYTSSKGEYIENSITEPAPLEGEISKKAEIVYDNANNKYVLSAGNIIPGTSKEVIFKVTLKKDERNKIVLERFYDEFYRQQEFRNEYLKSNYGLLDPLNNYSGYESNRLKIAGFHYEVNPNLQGITEPVRLGKKIAWEWRQASEIENDGVVFPKKQITTNGNLENVLYWGKDKDGKNVGSLLKITPSYDGYVTIWLEKGKTKISSLEPQKVEGNKENEVWVTVPTDKFTVNESVNVRVRYSPLKDDVENYDQVSALGEVEDYLNIKLVSPIKVEEITVEDLGVDLDGEFNTTNDVKEANNKIVKYHERVKYTVKVKNESSLPVILEDIKLDTNMGTYINGTLKVINGETSISKNMEKIENQDKSIFTYIPRDIEVPVNTNGETLTYSFEILEDREDIKNYGDDWRNRDRIYQGNIEHYNILSTDSKINRGMKNTLLNRQYATSMPNYNKTNRIENYSITARHYELEMGDGIAKLGEKIGQEDSFKNKIYESYHSYYGYYPDFYTEGDGVEFDSATVNGSKKNVIVSDAATEVKVTKVSHDGYISVWVANPESYDSSYYIDYPERVNWKNVTINEVYEVKKGTNLKVPVKIMGIVGKDTFLRIRYSPRKVDVLKAVDNGNGQGSVTGETEDYRVYGIPALETSFNRYDKKDHEKLGITFNNTPTGKQTHLGKPDNYYFGEDVSYKIIIRNTSIEALENKEIIFTTEMADWVSNTFEVYNGQMVEGKIDEFKPSDLNNTSRISIKKETEDTSNKDVIRYKYTITVGHLNGNEAVELRIPMKIREQLINRDDNNHYIEGNENLTITGIIKDTAKLKFGETDYRNSFGYNSEDIKIRAKHNMIVENMILNKNGITNDLISEHYDYPDKYNETEIVLEEKNKDDYSLTESDLRKANGGIDEKYLKLEPATIVNGKNVSNSVYVPGEYTLFQKAMNTIKFDVSRDGWVSIGLLPYSSYRSCGSIHFGYSDIWEGNNNVIWLEPQQVTAGTHSISLDLTGKDYWLKENILEKDEYKRFVASYTGILRIRYALTREEVLKPTGIAYSGEVEDYKINQFLMPVIADFEGTIHNDGGLSVKGTTIGANDGVVTIGEEFETKINIENKTSTTQKNLKVTLGTSMSTVQEVTMNGQSLSIKKLREYDSNKEFKKDSGWCGNSSWYWRYNFEKVRDEYTGNTFNEYEITLPELIAGQKGILTIKATVDKEISNNYKPEVAKITQYLLFDKRTIAQKDIYTLEYDMGSIHKLKTETEKEDSVKHFKFLESDNKVMYLGKTSQNSWTPEVSPKKYEEYGKGDDGEGVEKFKEYSLIEDNLKGKNVLNLDAVNTLNIRVKRDGFITLWTNVGKDNKWVSLSKEKKDSESQVANTYSVKAGENNIEFYLKSYQFNNLEELTPETKANYLNDKVLRIRYSPRVEDIDTYNKYSAMGEVEDYEYSIMPPTNVVFESWRDKGVETDIKNPNREDNIFGADDYLYTTGEVINQVITISNITSTNIEESSTDILNRSRIKFVSNIGEIDLTKWNVRLFANNSETPLTDSKDRVTVEGSNGVYYFKFNKLDGLEKLKINFDFIVSKETSDRYVKNDLYILERHQDQIGYVDEEVTPQFIEIGQHKKRIGHNMDGGLAGWHYKVKEEPHLGGTINYDGMNSRHSNTDLINTGDNDGIIKINDKEFTTSLTELNLATEVENSITVTATHEGFIQAWLEIINPDNKKIKHYPLFQENGKAKTRKLVGGNQEETLKFILPNEYEGYKFHDDSMSNGNTPNPRNEKKLKIRYGQIENQVNEFLPDSPNYGTTEYIFKVGSTGEAEDNIVNLIDSIDTYFAGYEELGVEVDDLSKNPVEKKIYGLKDGDVNYGERVRQSIIIENRGHQPLTSAILENKRVRFTSNNGIFELNPDNTTINMDRLNLEVTLNDQKVTADEYIEIERVSDKNYLFKVKKEILANGKLKLSFNYFVQEDNDNQVINDLYYINCYKNVNGAEESYHKANTNTQRDKQDYNKNVYPQMKKDMDNTAYVRHYKVKEEPKLGNTVSYVENLSGESISATTNDGVVIRKIATYIDEKENNKEGKPTLFTGEWNDVTVKPTEKGYITFWLDNEWETTNPPKLKTPIQLPIRIANTSKENEKDYLEPLIVEKEQKIEVLIPDGIYRNTNNNDASGTLTIRYSLVKDEITDLKKLSRVGEVEEYKVRVMPPVEARFLSPLDYGVKLNESADEHGGEGRRILDNIISMREMFDERVQFRNLHDQTYKTSIYSKWK